MIVKKIIKKSYIKLKRNAAVYKYIWQAILLRHLMPHSYTDANPLKIIYVDPHEIRYVQQSIENTAKIYNVHIDSNGGRFDKIRNIGRVIGGDWDESKDLMERCSYTFKILFDRYKNNLEWSDTDTYKEFKKYVEAGQRIWHGCTSIKQLDQRAAEVEELFRKMKQSGYRRKYGREKNTIINRLDEVTVNIDRNGNLLHNNSGTHRMVIAMLLNIKRIPVRVLVRHKQWQNIRDEILRAKQFEDCSTRVKLFYRHPDLNDIIPPEWKIKIENSSHESSA